ncbi:hypothetical protein EDB87DRAFT_1825678 [Lactarius vividus]|nr:hypothetical protein EDB87DRAFT_1825678 [Lactarius vividus]
MDDDETQTLNAPQLEDKTEAQGGRAPKGVSNGHCHRSNRSAWRPTRYNLRSCLRKDDVVSSLVYWDAPIHSVSMTKVLEVPEKDDRSETGRLVPPRIRHWSNNLAVSGTHEGTLHPLRDALIHSVSAAKGCAGRDDGSETGGSRECTCIAEQGARGAGLPMTVLAVAAVQIFRTKSRNRQRGTTTATDDIRMEICLEELELVLYALQVQ